MQSQKKTKHCRATYSFLKYLLDSDIQTQHYEKSISSQRASPMPSLFRKEFVIHWYLALAETEGESLVPKGGWQNTSSSLKFGLFLISIFLSWCNFWLQFLMLNGDRKQERRRGKNNIVR